MGEPIESEYFNWLCAKVLELGNPNYYDLLVILHITEFVWVIPADRNRAEDGFELREDFLRETGVEQDEAWVSQPCSIFEALIALSKRAVFQTDIPLRTWFWEFINNLKLDEFRRVSTSDAYEIEDILYTFIWRQYSSNGSGGVFPMCSTRKDQRKIELWYQFSEYVEDRGLF